MLGATPAAATSTVMRMVAAPASTGPGRRTGSTVLVARSRAIATSPEIARSSAMELQALQSNCSPRRLPARAGVEDGSEAGLD